MHETIFSRRTVLGATAAAAAALIPVKQALARTASMEGDWFDMVQAQHAMIATTFDQLLAAKSAGRRNTALNALAYQLTAHSVAEENVLYPALASNGFMGESDKLYLDQAHAKVLNATIDMEAIADAPTENLMEKARTLKAAVLSHAKDDEEGKFYPMLKQKLSASQNQLLTALYTLQFTSVKPVRLI